MRYLGINQHVRQFTISLWDENSNVRQALRVAGHLLQRLRFRWGDPFGSQLVAEHFCGIVTRRGGISATNRDCRSSQARNSSQIYWSWLANVRVNSRQMKRFQISTKREG